VALMTARSIDFHAINRAAVPALPVLLRRWLPDGKTARQPMDRA
jgi:hypothetical protein